jgi:hypothetical protein
MKKAKQGHEIALKKNDAPDRGPVNQLYNLSELKKMTGNNNDFLYHAISIFIQSSEEAIINLKRYLEKEEWLKIKEVAHKVLPSYRHLEVNTVIPKLVDLNNRISQDKVDAEIPSLVNEIVTNSEMVVKELRKELH